MAFSFNAILKFSSSAAEESLRRTKAGFENFNATIKKSSEAMEKAGKAAKMGAVATAPLALGVGIASKTAADFDFQMSAVKAVLLGTDEEMKKISDLAKHLGATTSFSAQQAAEGAELLAQAGFSADQVVAALPGVLNAAASSSIDLATAADIVASQLNAFGRPAKDATNVADALALTTALTNANFTDLGEAMKMAAPIAKNAGVSLEETAMAIGVLSNAGIKGTLAGTAFKDALLQLAKPSKESIELFGGKAGMAKALFQVENGVQKLLPIEVIMANVAKAVQGAKNPLEATAQAAEIFGLRGTTAFGAFQSKLLETTKVDERNMAQIQKGMEKTGEHIQLKVGDTIPSLVALRLQIAGASGTAREMAQIRLDNLKGQTTLFAAALHAVTLELGILFNKPIRERMKSATDFLSVLAIAFEKAVGGVELTKEQLEELDKNQFKNLLGTMSQFAQGFVEGFNEIQDTFKQVASVIQKFLAPLMGGSGDFAKSLGNIAAKIVVIGAIASPILAAVATGLFILGPILTSITSMVGILGSVFSFFGSTAGVLFNILRFGATIGIPLLTRAFSILSFVASPALNLLRMGAIALMGPLGLIALKVIAIGAIIAAAVLGIDALLHKVGLLKGPTLFEKTTGVFSGLKDRFFGGKKEEGEQALQGVPMESILSQGAISPNSSTANLVPEFLQTGIENQKLSSENIKQKAIVAPPSAEILEAIRQSGNNQGAAPSGAPQSMKLSGQLETRISGKDLNIVLTRAMIENSEANGRSIDPLAKRRAIQNGATFGVR